MKPNTFQRWNIKLRVTPQERRKIQKEAIDHDMRVSEYVKSRLLEDFSVQKNLVEGKST